VDGRAGKKWRWVREAGEQGQVLKYVYRKYLVLGDTKSVSGMVTGGTSR
jgi:hypothetical protein